MCYYKDMMKGLLYALVMFSVIAVPLNTVDHNNKQYQEKQIQKSIKRIETKIKLEKLKERLRKEMKGSSRVNYEDVHWLALNIYHEARGEKTLHGRMAVAFATLNRVTDRRWPDTMKGVVTQAWQFSWTMDNISDDPGDIEAWEDCWTVAKLSIELYNSMIRDGGTGDWLTKGANHYHAKTMKRYPRWASRMEKVAEIGNHIFYKA